MPTKIAACQVPDIRGDIQASLKWIEKFTKEAAAKDVSLICFPECFLQGYLTDMALTNKYAISLSAEPFKNILAQLAKYTPLIVLGMIEKEDDNLFNTAVVIQEGKLIGKYRKTHLLEGEKLFTAGTEYPVFAISNLVFGINICYDTQFAEPAAAITSKGAKLILCPSNNMMRYETAAKYKHLHHAIRIERAKENKAWLLSSDVTGERDGRIAYGPTSAIDPLGNVVAQVPLMETGMVIVDI